ncbi:MAG: hypothetical protein LAO31_18170 [Acidobacteriia bacterium]|nr:hypothetical protein [Terriglobia bacterium]
MHRARFYCPRGLLGCWFQFLIMVGCLCGFVSEAKGQTYPFDDITLQIIQAAPLSSSEISGNQFYFGTILLYRTNEGRYGKLLVLGYGYDLTIQWKTFNSNGTVFSQGSGLVIRGTFSGDLDSGTESSFADVASDFYWEQVTGTERYLVPRHGAQFAKFNCSYTLGPSAFFDGFGRAAWTTSLNVYTLRGCAWTMTGLPSWITINSGSSGNGNGTANLTIAANPGNVLRYSNPRVGDATGGTTFLVAQNGQSCTATFNPPNATFSPSAGTGSFTMSTPATCFWNIGSTSWVTVTSVTASAAPFGNGYRVGNGTITYSVAANPDTSDRTADPGYPFNFHITQRGLNQSLTLTKAGSGTGTVTSAPPGINCGSTCSFSFSYNQQVTLTAQAGANSIFTGWSGEGCTGTGTCLVTMTQARNVTATFALIGSQTLTVTKAGSGTGTVTSVPSGINCGSACSSSFPYNQQVALTAQADQNSNFGGWSGEGCSGTGACNVTMTQARNVTATFTLIGSQTLTVTKAGSGTGRVTSSPSGINCGNNCVFSFPYNSQVTLTAQADTNSDFAGWSGEDYSGTGPCIMTMSQAHNVTANFTAKQAPGSQVNLPLPSLGAGSVLTQGRVGPVRAGYATVSIDSGAVPYGTAVFSFSANGIVVSEAGVPVSPPTTSARLFVDYRPRVSTKSDHEETGVISINTGFAAVNRGSGPAHLLLRLRDANGNTLAQGTGTLAPGAHVAKFIDQLGPDFVLPSTFGSTGGFGSLEVTSDQPVSVIALRLTANQRGETLLTSTPIADLTQSVPGGVISFPQLVDGGGYQTALILLNTSASPESGMIWFYDDLAFPLLVRLVGASSPAATIPYNIPAGGFLRIETDASSPDVKAGSVRVVPVPGTGSPVGAGVFGYTARGILVTESGIPSATLTSHARVFVDMSSGHNTGLAIADVTGDARLITVSAYPMDGSYLMGSGSFILPGKGHTAKFADQMIVGLLPGFKGVLDISSTTPFAALTLRSLSNARGDFLLTTFPLADVTRPAPVPLIFPQIADGGGYQTQFIFLSTTGAANTTVSFFDDDGSPLPVGKGTPDNR